MKKLLTSVVVFLLVQMFFVQPTFAKSKEEKVKEGIISLGTGTGANVKLKLKNGTKIKGYVVDSNANEFTVMNFETMQPVTVPYSNVKQIKGNNLSSGVVIAIGVVAALVFIIILGTSLK